MNEWHKTQKAQFMDDTATQRAPTSVGLLGALYLV